MRGYGEREQDSYHRDAGVLSDTTKATFHEPYPHPSDQENDRLATQQYTAWQQIANAAQAADPVASLPSQIPERRAPLDRFLSDDAISASATQETNADTGR
jgi:hypothetical protein